MDLNLSTLIQTSGRVISSANFIQDPEFSVFDIELGPTDTFRLSHCVGGRYWYPSDTWWFTSAQFHSTDDIGPREDVCCVLYRLTDGRYGMIMPFDPDAATGTHTSVPALTVKENGTFGVHRTCHVLLVACSPEYTDQLYARSSIHLRALLASKLPLSPLPSTTWPFSPTPCWFDHLDGLGACTWDMFYRDVNHPSVISAIRKIQASGTRLQYVILDDGWQRTTKYGQLQDWNTNEKFPGGLKALVKDAEEEGVRRLIVWHALQGYWLGVEDGERVDTPDKLREVASPDAAKDHIDARIPRNAEQFYDEGYATLSKAGISGCKIDCQATLTTTAHEHIERLQRAALHASKQHFPGSPQVNCMSHDLSLLHTLLATTHPSNPYLIRASDDFIPHNSSSHAPMLKQNILNSGFISMFGLPDWDMFRTHLGESPEWVMPHLLSRLISGGPVYVSDDADKHNVGLISKCEILSAAGRIIPRLARPGASKLEDVVRGDDGVFVVWNTCGDDDAVKVCLVLNLSHETKSYKLLVVDGYDLVRVSYPIEWAGKLDDEEVVIRLTTTSRAAVIEYHKPRCFPDIPFRSLGLENAWLPSASLLWEHCTGPDTAFSAALRAVEGRFVFYHGGRLIHEPLCSYVLDGKVVRKWKARVEARSDTTCVVVVDGSQQLSSGLEKGTYLVISVDSS
ncbi:glycoside hydrolase [Saitoella complicata NRRL Y-17804]|uniref:glycoside hydrolase n=1 Tax=Saitoella complicata (strain BCRC 22490 / CBS 7301 / JCM 7358 / NBRC 10748 / NRRL Y-17804) TaxID=698492 RepID=UPI000866DC18|nr:glycoside hydrolase [Saitoella complicata NRRL Y-17804]ODQ50069.1 glycoside hydrolase [Saitoella complicata NRRL Y-17804]